ncbi:MAG: ABC transporter ATP-binding protein [Candidatus Rokubacteria bacterium]|nr:ABC transporter ATP-binding protein [Candidatus Rokubacteria bacterium]
MSADAPGGAALEARGLDVLYGDYQILWDVSFSAARGEVVAILGPNGSGKSTLMNTLSGLVRARSGEIQLGDRRIDGLPPHKIVGLGLAHVLERRRLFPYLTVRQNLLLGAYHPGARARREETLADVEALFPHLRERQTQMAGTLSGGEQQMVAIGRALMSNPEILLCDEISLGLAPVVIREIYAAVPKIKENGATLIVVEQDIGQAMKVADRVLCMMEGRITLEGRPGVLPRQTIHDAYFGVNT